VTQDAAGFTLFDCEADPALAARMTDVRRVAVRRVTGEGYQLWYRAVERTAAMPGVVLPRRLYVEARRLGARCGMSEFSESKYGYFQVQGTTAVEEADRRRGLAEAMYVVAEVVSGRVLAPFWSDTGSQSPEGAALWKLERKGGRVRPFGGRDSPLG
jgi:hypothetical protein